MGIRKRGGIIPMSNDYKLNLLSEELDKYKAVVLKLTEENEELKKEINLYKSSIISNHDRAISKRFTELLEENEELKEENKKIQKRLERYKNANERLYDAQVDDFNFTKTKYKQALEEIREMAKIAFIVCDDECGNANKFAEIQDKINEVLK